MKKLVISELLSSIISFSNRGSKSAVVAPSLILNSVPKSSVWYIKFIGPLTDGLPLSLKSYKDILPSIDGLFRKCSPYAIIWTIPPLIIGALKSFPRWLSSHIGKEILKFEPTIAYIYSSTSIILVTFIGRPIASAFHFSPCIIFNSPGHIMRNRPLSSHFIIKATTRFCASTNQISSQAIYFISTFTKAPPYHLLASILRSFDNRQSSEFLAGHINKIMCFFTHNRKIASYGANYNGRLYWLI